MMHSAPNRNSIEPWPAFGRPSILLAAVVLALAGCLTRPHSPPPTTPAPVVAAPEWPVIVAAPDVVVDDPSRETVLMVQTRLRERGYDPGPLDGLLGPRTRVALDAFTRDAGLPSTSGAITERLLAEIDIAAPSTSGVEPSDEAPTSLPGDIEPAYSRGDAYVYSDGRVETVDAVDGDVVIWRTREDMRYRASRNFVLPQTGWRSGGRVGQRRLTASAGTLWPLSVGRRVQFSAAAVLMRDSDRQDQTKWRETWDCEVAAVETVAVPAGRFDTFKLVCFRQTDPAGIAWRRVWYYAPAVRHYVRRIDSYADDTPPRVVDLVAVRLGGAGWPPAARTGLEWALADGLDNRVDGEEFTWQSSAVDGDVRIEIGTTSRNADGAACRSYVQVLTTAAGERRYPALACRDSGGAWNVPG